MSQYQVAFLLPPVGGALFYKCSYGSCKAVSAGPKLNLSHLQMWAAETTASESKGYNWLTVDRVVHTTEAEPGVSTRGRSSAAKRCARSKSLPACKVELGKMSGWKLQHYKVSQPLWCHKTCNKSYSNTEINCDKSVKTAPQSEKTLNAITAQPPILQAAMGSPF